MKTQANQFGPIKSLQSKVYAYLYAFVAAGLDKYDGYKTLSEILCGYSQNESVEYADADLLKIKRIAEDVCGYIDKANVLNEKKDITPIEMNEELRCGMTCFFPDGVYTISKDRFVEMSKDIHENIIPGLRKLI